MMPQSEPTPTNIPRSFICPLTMEAMVDPVIDAEGNTFERRALLQWLSHYGVSPISRQPLNSSLVVPNFALRETIHEVMGSAWVTQQTEEMELEYSEMEDVSESSIESTGSTRKSHASKHRGKIQCYLQKLSQDVGGGMQLELDDSGVCMFKCHDMTIVVEVPTDVGFFFIYTVVSVPSLSEESKDMMLELNRLHSETRKSFLVCSLSEVLLFVVHCRDLVDLLAPIPSCLFSPSIHNLHPFRWGIFICQET